MADLLSSPDTPSKQILVVSQEDAWEHLRLFESEQVRPSPARPHPWGAARC